MIFALENTEIRLSQENVYMDSHKVVQSDKILVALHVFIKSANSIVSKESLMQALWGDMVVSDDSLFKIIQEVRKVFKTHGFSPNILANVYGKGYKITSKITAIEEVKPPIVLEATTSVAEEEKQAKPKQQASNHKKKIPTKYFLMIAASIVVIMLVYVVYFGENQSVLSQEKYQEYLELVKKDSKISLQKLARLKKNNSLSNSDAIKVNYLIGSAYYYSGNYPESLKALKEATDLSVAKNPSIVIGDAYLLQANINTYTGHLDLMWLFINKAEEIYEKLNYRKGLYLAHLYRARYYLTNDEFQKAVDAFNALIESINEPEYLQIKTRAHINLAHVYALQNKNKESLKHIIKTQELAIQLNLDHLITYSYSALAENSFNQGEFEKAMKYAEIAMNFTLEQNDLNQFQQNFSAFYNILSALGHDELAGFYLQKAIDYQYQANSKGHLNIAELNLGIHWIKIQAYKKAQKIFETLLTYEISDAESREYRSWLALSRYLQKDNIRAYTIAKEVFYHNAVTDKTKLIAGIALALSAIELERSDESFAIFKVLEKIASPNWLIEYHLFLKTALTLFENNNQEQLHLYLSKKVAFEKRQQQIKLATLPDPMMLTQLDQLLNKIILQ